MNANSRDFLKNLGLWKKLKSNFEPIDKIVIKDYVNKENLIFQNSDESMGSVIFNRSLLKISRDFLFRNKILLTGIDFNHLNPKPKTIVSINKKKYFFNKVIISLGKNYFNSEKLIKNTFDFGHQAYVGFLTIKKIIIKQHMKFLLLKDPLLSYPLQADKKKIQHLFFLPRIK